MPSDSLAMHVLTNRAPICHVTGCLRGIPQFVFEFQRNAVPKFFNVKPPQYSRCRRAPPDFPKRAGLLAHVAIVANDQKMLEALFELSKHPQCAHMERMSFSQAMRCAAFCGRLEMPQWMVCVFATDPSLVWEPQLMEKVLLNIDTPPSVELLEWLYEHCPPMCREIRDPEKMLVQRAKHGNLDVVRFFHTRGHVLSQPAIDTAAWSRNLELVRFLHETYPDGFTASAMDFAASNGHLEIIKFLYDNRTENCTVHAMSQAAANNHLPTVQYLRGMGKPCNQKATDAAANGHIDGSDSSISTAAKAAHKKPWTRSITSLEGVNSKDRCYEMEEAVVEEQSERDYFIKTVYCPDSTDVEARNRHLQVTKFLREHRTEGCTELAMNEVARRGHLEVVQFLHESRSEGCTEEAMDCAAWKGHLEIVKFLHANRSEGCTKDAMDYAAREGHLDIVRFLHENRSERCSTRAIDFAASHRHLDVVQFLHENHTEGCMTNAMDEAAKEGHLDVVKFSYANRTEGCTSKAMDAAGKHGHLEIIKFLCEKGLGGSTLKALNHAAYSGDLPMVKFLYVGRGMAG